MSAVLPYLIAAIFCNLLVALVSIIGALFIGLGKRVPGYYGTLVGFGSVVGAVWLMTLLPFAFGKATLIIPALGSLWYNMNRVEGARENQRVASLELGHLYGEVLGYGFAAFTILSESPIL